MRFSARCTVLLSTFAFLGCSDHGAAVQPRYKATGWVALGDGSQSSASRASDMGGSPAATVAGESRAGGIEFTGGTKVDVKLTGGRELPVEARTQPLESRAFRQPEASG